VTLCVFYFYKNIGKLTVLPKDVLLRIILNIDDTPVPSRSHTRII
jgi:hypothetical protein